MSENKNIPEVDIKLETKKVESKIIHVPWITITTPYFIIMDSNGTRKVWIKSKRKILLYYIYKLTRIKWFIKQYNK